MLGEYLSRFLDRVFARRQVYFLISLSIFQLSLEVNKKTIILTDFQFLFFRQLLVSFAFQRVANVCLAIRVCGVCDIDNSTLASRLEERAWSLLFHIYSK